MKVWKSLAMAAALFAGAVGFSQAADIAPAERVRTEVNAQEGAHFPVGNYNSAYKDTFTGDSYLSILSKDPSVPVVNVTFVNGAHTYWHRHEGTCQILIGASGVGYYQIWGEKPHQILPGQTVTIPEGVKHWHGAAPGTTFQHVVAMKPGAKTIWE
jgi:quercetin dioxygenase-like cupin family protein